MSTYLIIKYAHLIAFVYWLGGDLGTFLASRQVVNDRLSPESRQVALKIMLGCDMGPKLAMPLTLALGLHLAHLGGSLPITATVLGAAWLLCAYWFAAVLVLHLKEGTAFAARLARVDFYFRIAVALALLAWAAAWLGATLGTNMGAGEAGVVGAQAQTASLLNVGLNVSQSAGWAITKLAIFALMVCCGLAVRVHLRPFVPAFAEMMSSGASAAGNATMRRAIARCRPWVWCIWGSLFVNAAIGIHLIG